MSVDEVANRVIEKVVKATNARSAVLNLLDERGRFERSFGPKEPPPRSDGTTMRICQQGQPLVIIDSQEEARGIPPHLTEKGIRASIGLPLKAGKQSIGVLFVRHSEPHHFSQREIETLFIFANQAAIAIQNARLYEQVQQHNAELEEYVAEQTFELQVLYELAQALGHATQLTDVIRSVLLHLYRAIPYDLAASLV
jgi:GAF domain-containing protein